MNGKARVESWLLICARCVALSFRSQCALKGGNRLGGLLRLTGSRHLDLFVGIHDYLTVLALSLPGHASSFECGTTICLVSANKQGGFKQVKKGSSFAGERGQSLQQGKELSSRCKLASTRKTRRPVVLNSSFLIAHGKAIVMLSTWLVGLSGVSIYQSRVKRRKTCFPICLFCCYVRKCRLCFVFLPSRAS